NCSGKTREHLALLLKQILALWPCPHGEKRSISATHAMRSTSDLAFRVRVLASVGSPNLIQDFAPLSIRPRTVGARMNEERRHFRDGKAEASEFRLTQEAPFVSISESQRAPLPGLNWLATIHYGPSDLLELCEQRKGKELFCRQPGIDLIYERTTACECGLASHRWHTEAVGSSAQMRCGFLPCCAYRVMAKSGSRAARLIQMFMRIRASPATLGRFGTPPSRFTYARLPASHCV